MNPAILYPEWSYRGEPECNGYCDGRCMCDEFCGSCDQHESMCRCDAPLSQRDIDLISNSAAFTPKAEPAVSADNVGVFILFVGLFACVAMFAGA